MYEDRVDRDVVDYVFSKITNRLDPYIRLRKIRSDYYARISST